jgi:hypothetical protein
LYCSKTANTFDKIIVDFLKDIIIVSFPISDSANAHSLDEILWGRFLVGLGIGVNAVLVPIYISEVLVDINVNFVVNSYSCSPIIIG